MNKASERYNTKVEIPISVILETIFSDDNKDVETLCRWAKKYEFVDLEDKYYKLQEDYTKQSFYIWLSKKERKQYDYEDYLLNKNEQLQQRIDKAIEYMQNFDIFDKFSFPLMKKWEEQEVKSSIEYEFNNSLYKDLVEILKGKE